VRISIDSGEPLSEVIRVIEAVYQVSVTIDRPAQSTRDEAASARPRKRSPQGSGRRAAAKAIGRSRATGSTTSPANAPASGSSADIRAWARQHGHPVGDTGRISGQVIAAYQQAH